MPLFSAPKTLAPPVSQSSLLVGLAASWCLDEGGGVRFDRVGNSHLRPRSSLAQDNLTSDLGRIRAGVLFNGGSSLRAASNPALRLGDIDFTIAFWINSPNLNNYQCPASEWNAGSPADSVWVFEIYGNRAYFSVRAIDDTHQATVAAPVLLSNGAWHLIIGYHSAASNVLGIIVDDNPPSELGWSDGCRSGTADLVVGSYANTYGSPVVERTIIENLSLWKRLLSTLEIEKLWNNGLGLRYPFNGA